MKAQVKDMLTGIDGETIDPARVLWVIGTLVFYAGAIQQMFLLKFDMQTYGIGMAAVLAGGGAAIKIKESSEPKAL